MKVLLITQEPPLRADEVVSGNAVRTRQLLQAMTSAGHQVDQVWLCRKRRRDSGEKQFRNGDDLRAIIAASQADAIVVSYWELLEMLPYETPAPVVLDFVAPRPLEELYESPESVRPNLRRLSNVLRLCDLILVGNELQKHLLMNNLLEAGMDLREGIPLAVVPLGAEPRGAPGAHPDREQLTLVTGGVNWPWRSDHGWSEALKVAARKYSARVVIFGGQYRWHAKDEGSAFDQGGDSTHSAVENDPVAEHRGLEPYVNFGEFLAREAHIGVELSAWNIERAYSQSFRSLEFLRQGLPMICNSYLPIAELIEQYKAGWLVDKPEDLEPILESISRNPQEWEARSEGALRLVSKELNPLKAASELLRWLDKPRRAARIAVKPDHKATPPVLGVPPLAERVRRQLKLARQFGVSRLLGLTPDKQAQRDKKHVIIVTRADLFPPDHGAAVRTVETARALAKNGCVVGLVTDERKFWYRVGENDITRQRFPWWLKLLSVPGPVAKLLHHSKDLPHANSFLYLPLSDNSYYWRILAANKHIGAGILQAEFPAYARPCIEAAEVIRSGVVMVEHNVEYDRLRSQVGELSKEQFERFRSIELDLCSRVDAVVCVSDNDRRTLEMAGVQAGSLHTIPHGVNIEAADSADPIDVCRQFNIPAADPVLVFHGTFSYPPNREAIRILAEIILPGLEDRGVPAHVLAVGRDAPATSPHPRIHFTGSVEAVAPWLKAASVAVVPLVDGGGTRMKILDCFAARVPVVSTSKGIEGIPAGHGVHALIEDEWPGFVEAIIDLLENKELAENLASEGHQYASSLDWGAIGERYLRLYATL